MIELQRIGKSVGEICPPSCASCSDLSEFKIIYGSERQFTSLALCGLCAFKLNDAFMFEIDLLEDEDIEKMAEKMDIEEEGMLLNDIPTDEMLEEAEAEAEIEPHTLPSEEDDVMVAREKPSEIHVTQVSKGEEPEVNYLY